MSDARSQRNMPCKTSAGRGRPDAGKMGLDAAADSLSSSSSSSDDEEGIPVRRRGYSSSLMAVSGQIGLFGGTHGVEVPQLVGVEAYF